MNFRFKCKLLDEEKNKSLKENLMDYIEGFLVEFLGAILLSYFGCACFGGTLYEALGGSLCFGFTYASIVQIFFFVDLAQINPAITLSYYIFGMFSLPMMFVYIFAQILGSLVGTLLIQEMTTKKILIAIHRKWTGYCTINLQNDITYLRAFAWEFGFSCFLILFVCSIVETKNLAKFDSWPLKFGLLLMFPMTYIGVAYTGGSVNPALILGRALVVQEWKDTWIALTAPLLASIVTTIGYHILFLPKDGEVILRELMKRRDKEDFHKEVDAELQN
ncbi:aquaporin-2-like isoform X2 [Rhodnius prolixus]|uniref:aquaporin-2-like isoform X2 n=1 Tax=Rhodnius prolixus TaxID=13249 RepID=UPI003D188C00